MRARIKSINDNGVVRVVKCSKGTIWKDYGVKVSSSGSAKSIKRAGYRKLECDRRSYDLAKTRVC